MKPLSDTECAKHDARVDMLFVRHDSDESGTLSRSQLQSALRELGVAPRTDAELDMLVSRTTDSGGVSLREFHWLFDASRLRAVFDELDAAKNGVITLRELEAALESLGVSRAHAKRMLARLDEHGVSWDAFYAAFEFEPAASLRAVARRWGQLTVCGDSEFSGPTSVPGNLTVSQTVVAGTLSSICARTATAPLERLKVDAQTTVSTGSLAAAARKIVKSEGIAGLFRGNLLHCLRAFPTGVVTCATYTWFEAETATPHRLEQAAWTAVAAGLATALTYPLDSLRTRWITARKKTSVLSLLSAILRREGPVKGLLGGLTPTLYAVVPFHLVQQATLDALQDSAHAGPASVVVFGALAGLVAQTVVMPFEVVHRRMQTSVERRRRFVFGDAPMPLSTFPALRHILEHEGPRSLYRGFALNCLKCVPAAAVGSFIAISLVEFYRRQNDRVFTEYLNGRLDYDAFDRA